MSHSRVLAPDLTTGTPVKGPASYFASIERTYGRPVQEWIDIVVAELDGGRRHMDVVGQLKQDHGMGHGHANAVVAFVRSELGA